jgi:hypothetical protein
VRGRDEYRRALKEVWLNDCSSAGNAVRDGEPASEIAGEVVRTVRKLGVDLRFSL